MGSQPLTLQAARQWALTQLMPMYAEAEAQAIVRRLLRHLMPDWEQQWLLSQGQVPFPSEYWPFWQEAIARLKQEEPLAYILGEVVFDELRLEVQPGVFIPRPETEQWVRWIVHHRQDHPPRYILDIGTGSGAIALSLAYHFKDAQVFAVDKSPIALATAAHNAKRYGYMLNLACVEVGKEPLPPHWPTAWDLIVANPPYIPWQYWNQTERRVRLYEPPDALFCKDKEVYEAIGKLAWESLSVTGECVVELFPPTALEIRELWEKIGLMCELHEDMAGHLRWLRAVRRQLRAE